MTTLRAGGATHAGQIRSGNEDAQLIAEAHQLFGVADGMGGHQGGEIASAMAVATVAELATAPDLDTLKDAVRRANRLIFERAGVELDLHGMGTTFCAVQVVSGAEGDEIAWVNVGDSRVYLFRDDQLIQLSQDHSLVEDLLRDGQLTPDEAANHPRRNIITRALGIDVDVAVDGGTVLPFAGDRFLVCSDGLFNEVSADQMSSVLRRLADPGDAADELVRLANEGGGRDNITVVVVDVTDDDGRALEASAALAGSDRVTSVAPVVTTSLESTPAAPVPDDDVFVGRRSSLPDPNLGSDGERGDDLFGGVEAARSRRFTVGVAAFFVALFAIVGLGLAAIGWSAHHTYFVAFTGDKVAVYTGKPGGVLWFDPVRDQVTAITRQSLPPAVRQQITKNKTFSSRADVDTYLQNLVAQATPPTTTTTTTTTLPGTPGLNTTSTTPGATSTTAVTSTTKPSTGP